MAQQNEHLDFSGLFKLDVLIHLDITTHSVYELGLKKFMAFSSEKELLFLYINQQGERFQKEFDWDFVDNPIYCMCFEPSGTWVVVISDQKVLLVPFLPLFIPQNTFDCKWSLSGVTVLPLGTLPSRPTSVVFWLTKDSENVAIIGTKNGNIIFYSLESQTIIGETKVPSEVIDLQICFDDSLDLLTLLISGNKSYPWKLVLEHRSVGYNWLQQIRNQLDKDKKDGFMSYIRQLSKDKITLLIQGGSKDDNKSTVEYVLKPTEYLPIFRKGSNNWALTAQYVNGRHFLTAFEMNEGTLILESPEEDTPSRTLRPRIKKDGLYMQGLWSQRLIYLLRKNELEVHSSSFSVIQGAGLLGTKRDFTELWSAEVIGDIRKAYLLSAKELPSMVMGWQEPTFLCDLQLPRFSLEPCLIVTNCGAYLLNNVTDPCEWLVGLIMRGGVGAEQAAAGLGAAVPPLLRAAADTLLSRGNIAPANYLYSLSQSPPDGWVARLGVFGRLHELSMYKPTGNTVGLGNAAIAIKLLASLLKMSTNAEEKFDMNVKFTSITTVELSELSSIAASLGLWELLPLFSIHRGHPQIMLTAFKSRKDLCRGAIQALVDQKCLVQLLLEENSQWLFDLLVERSDKFDSAVLQAICLWLNPMQDQLRPVMRDLKQGITTIYTTRLQQLISTFIRIVSYIEARDPSPDIHLTLTHSSETWKNQFLPKTSLSCGLAHWAVAAEGSAAVMMTSTQINTDVIGRVVDVACGRHHTLVLTENGIYASGDNTYGQLGTGTSYVGGIGDSATAAGALYHISESWTAPVVAVAAGHYHSAAVDLGGRLYTWGWGVHGQLGLGNIDDQLTPHLVTKFQGRKVLNIGCGACHTIVLMKNGEVWAFGAAVFGQLGSSNREKSSIPIRVTLPDPIEMIAVGYFHTLALTPTNTLYYWGASPQQVRAAHTRRAASPAPEPPNAGDMHLTPQCVDLRNVKGRIVKISAGWHHSCLLNNVGNLYVWGLNFDGQLGSGDRKQITLPTEVRIRHDLPENCPTAKTPDIESQETTEALVGCGGDFTIYIDEDGKVYATGNMHLQGDDDKYKGNRVIMMKTTKRVIKIPASKGNNKFMFQPIDRIDIMFPFDIDDLERKPIDPRLNPLLTTDDFNNKTWSNDVMLILKPWIKESDLKENLNMSAKLAYHNNLYMECLKLLLDNLKTELIEEKIYLTHTEIPDNEKEKPTISRRKDEVKIMITNIMSKRIKEVALTILNEKPYPVNEETTYKSLPCCCEELKYLPEVSSPMSKSEKDENMSAKAAHIIDKCISLFPVDSSLWESCFRLSKNFFLDNNLQVSDLEAILRKYMESNATTMSAAIMYSSDCAQYSEILSPKFYLNMCSQVLDTWG